MKAITSDTRKWSGASACARELKVHELAHLGRLDLVISRAYKHPEEIQYTDKFGRSVLHQVVRKRPSLQVVRKIVNIHPGAIHQHDIIERTPVDIALCYDANIDVVNYLKYKCVQLKKYRNDSSVEEYKENGSDSDEVSVEQPHTALNFQINSETTIAAGEIEPILTLKDRHKSTSARERKLLIEERYLERISLSCRDLNRATNSETTIVAGEVQPISTLNDRIKLTSARERKLLIEQRYLERISLSCRHLNQPKNHDTKDVDTISYTSTREINHSLINIPEEPENLTINQLLEETHQKCGRVRSMLIRSKHRFPNWRSTRMVQ